MDKINLTDALKKLEEINEWFENQEEIDVELGLEKVKEGVKLVKESQKRLKEVENEFEEVKKDLSGSDSPLQDVQAEEDFIGDDEDDSGTIDIEEILF